jgi:hypothetical protein
MTGIHVLEIPKTNSLPSFSTSDALMSENHHHRNGALFFFTLYQKETYSPCWVFSSNLLSSLNGEQYLPASV